MMTQPTVQPPAYPTNTQTATTLAKSAKPARFGLFFGIAATILTVGAIALAVFAPELTTEPRLAVPQGWQQVYSNKPMANQSAWALDGSCAFPNAGLAVESDSACAFQPQSASALAGGVLITAKLAPAAEVNAAEDAGILLDDKLLLIVFQDGTYYLCQDYHACDSSSTSSSASNSVSEVATGSSVAWHGDAFTTNEIALLYSPDQATVSFYANGQFVNRIPSSIGAVPSIALTTSADGEAIFTHVAIYAGSPS